MTISSEITNILNDLGNRLGVVIDWGNQNIVPYIQELVKRIAYLRIANCIIWLVVAVILTVVIIKTIKWLYKYSKSDERDVYSEDMIYIGGITMTIIFATIALIGYIWALSELPEAIFLPEITAIEYIKDATGGTQ